MFFTLLIPTIALALFTLLPIWRYEEWWVRALDFPRLQLFVISLLLLLIEGALLDLSRPVAWFLPFVAVGCMAYQSWWIVPYTRLFPVEVPSASHSERRKTIRIMTANVLTSNRNARRLLEMVRENAPDILVTLESDAWWQEKLDALETEYSYTIKCPRDNLYGMHVYSKLPLTNSRIDYLVESDVPSMHAKVRLSSGDTVRMHFLHPAPPSPSENEESSERDAELIIVARSVAETHAPVIVTGDLNDVAWSETTRLFRKLSGLLDPRVGRGMFNTFHADHWFLRWPLDHLFHSNHFTLADMRRLEKFGSDHFPLFTELTYEPDRNVERHSPDPDADDLSEAKDKAQDENVSKEDVPRPE